jgi:hypothetical protein
VTHMSSPHDQPRRVGLSKSRLTLFEQCPKRLWLSVYRPDLADESAGVSHAMREGHDIGAIACALHPDGYMIEADAGLAAACEETRHMLSIGWDKPMFEASFAHEGVLVRVDLMLPTDEGWHVAEVKSTTGVKAYHLADIATQLWVMGENAVPIASAAIRHIDRSFTLAVPNDYEGLFTDTLVTDVVAPIIADRPLVAAAARAVLAGGEPVRAMGDHCSAPFTCSFQSYCARIAPAPTLAHDPVAGCCREEGRCPIGR